MEGPTLPPHPSFPFSRFHTLDYDMIVRFSPQVSADVDIRVQSDEFSEEQEWRGKWGGII